MKKGTKRIELPGEAEAVSFLTEPKTTEAAYLLGFLWADGTAKIRYNVSTEICTADFEDIVDVLEKTQIPWKITHRKRSSRQAQTCFRVSNKPLFEFLQNCDFSEKETACPRKMLETIPVKLHPNWWHGYFDGDGSFYTNPRWSTFQVCFASHHDTDWQYRLDVLKKLGIENIQIRQQVTDKSRASYLRITNKSGCQRFLSYIYDLDCKMGLARKKTKVAETMKMQ